MAVRKVVLLPCGETELQAQGVLTGWAQDGLSAKGREQAQEAGKLLTDASFSFDALFTSVQKQAICTGWLALMEGDRVAVPHIQSFRLNDRHWGVYQGKGKPAAEEDLKAAPQAVPRSDAQHPCNDALYRGVPASAQPGSESMTMVVDRTLPFWHDAIAPFLLSGKTPLVVAHEGSVRAICQALEDDTDAEALQYEILPGVPLVVELDEEELEFRKRAPLSAKGVAKARRFSLTPAAGSALRQGPTPKPKAKAKVTEPGKPKEDYTVEISVVGAKGLRDADWFSGTSDPYVKCTVLGKGSGEFRTKTLGNIRAEDVKWDHVEKVTLKHGDSIDFEVYDEDMGKSDDFLGKCTLRFDDILHHFEGTLKLVDEKGKAMPGKKNKGCFLTVGVNEIE